MENVFQEAYVGKTQTLLEAEQILNRIVDAYKKEVNVDMINHPLNKELEHLIQKQFGFKNVYITWYRSSVYTLPGIKNATDLTPWTPNAFTMLSAYVLFDNSTITLRGANGKTNRYYDTKHVHTLSIEISYLLPSSGLYTGGELLAIILHEIGHNFDCSPYWYYGEIIYATMIVRNWLICGTQWMDFLKQGEISNENLQIFLKNIIITIGTTVAGTAPYKMVTHTINRLMNKVMDVVPFASAIEHLGISFMRLKEAFRQMDPRIFLTNIRDLAVLATTQPRALLRIPVSHIGQIPTKKKEIFADSFAVAYGYGPEMARALEKLDTLQWNELKAASELTPLTAFFADFRKSNEYLISILLYPNHGTDVERTRKMIVGMKRDLRSVELHPSMKKKLENDIQEMETTLQTYMKTTYDKKLYISAVMQWFLVEICDGNAFLLERLFPDMRA